MSSVLVLASMLAQPAVARAASASSPTATSTTSSGPGYWLVGSDGSVYQRSTTNFGGLGSVALNAPIVGGAATQTGLGYWLVGSDGGVFAFNAPFYGSMGGVKLNQPIVGMAEDPATGGYWLVAADGGVFAFNAPFYGSMGGVKLNQPVVGIAATPGGGGYWLVAADGGIFSFGNAGFYGSTGDLQLNKPVVGMAADPATGGYWLVASDGGIFSFNAPFYGSTGAMTLDAPVVGMVASQQGNGYWLAAQDGGVFTFGSIPFLGAANKPAGAAPIVAMVGTDSGLPFPPGATGFDVSNYQCAALAGGTLPAATDLSMVEITGYIANSNPNPCYKQEAQWAGPNMSAYIFMDPLPLPTTTVPAPPESLTGPAGNCATGDTVCEGYNFGFYWAEHWVAYARSVGTNPSLWWLDVETGVGWSTQSTQSNSQVISGAVAGLRAMDVEPGLYSDYPQWSAITGNLVLQGTVPLWSPGGGNVTGGSFSAQSICDGTAGPDYAPFAGGNIVVVQYGLTGNGYNGPPTAADPDYACNPAAG
ncbi:MAG: hypothetical protein ACP5P1_05535 [Acidimicrobiales bacterium]